MGFFSEKLKNQESHKQEASAPVSALASDPYAAAPNEIREVVSRLNKLGGESPYRGERSPTKEEWEGVIRDRTTVASFFRFLGLEEGASRLEKIIVPANVVMFSSDGGRGVEEVDGSYDPINKITRLKEQGSSYPAPQNVEHTRVHEFFHTSSASSDHESISLHSRGAEQVVRIMCGFGIVQGTFSESTTPESFFFGNLNEGMTELLTGLALIHTKKLSGYGYHGEYTKPYAPYRYIALLLVYALAYKLQEKEEVLQRHVAIKEAVRMLSKDYVDSTFHFAKDIDAFFGAGTIRDLARVHANDEVLLNKFLERMTSKVLTDQQKKEGIKSPDAKRLLGYGDTGVVGAALEKEIIQALQA